MVLVINHRRLPSLGDCDLSAQRQLHPPFPSLPSTKQTCFVPHEVMQTRQESTPELWRALMTSTFSDYLQRLPPMPVPLSMAMSLPPIFLTMASTDINSKDFLSILKRLLRSKGEHKLLAQLEGPTAIYVADILDNVGDHWTAASHET